MESTFLLVPMDEYLRDYQSIYMSARNFAPATRSGYSADIRQFLSYIGTGFGITHPNQILKKHLLAYLADADRRGLTGATRARGLAAIRSFFAYLTDADIIAANPASNVHRPKQAARTPRVLTEEEYRRLQAGCSDHPRDRAIIELFLQTGLRLSEVANLKLIDLLLPQKPDEQIGSVTVTGKGSKKRVVSLNWKACQAIDAYLGQRPCAKTDRVFLSSRAQAPLGPRAIQQMVKKHMERAAITGATVHTLRHTFATHMVRRGTNLRVVQEALGHSSLQTTSLYVSLARELMDEQLQANAL